MCTKQAGRHFFFNQIDFRLNIRTHASVYKIKYATLWMAIIIVFGLKTNLKFGVKPRTYRFYKDIIPFSLERIIRVGPV